MHRPLEHPHLSVRRGKGWPAVATQLGGAAGNAPTMMAWAHLARVAPVWMNTSLAIFNDEETAKEWGWVQEMCAGSPPYSSTAAGSSAAQLLRRAACTNCNALRVARTCCRYAFTIACYLEHVPKVALHKQIMAQPPWDSGQCPLSTNPTLTVNCLPDWPPSISAYRPSVCESAEFDN